PRTPGKSHGCSCFGYPALLWLSGLRVRQLLPHGSTKTQGLWPSKPNMKGTTMTEINNIENLLNDDGPVALIIKQPLAPVDEDDHIIFPPTYPVTDWNGRVHTI